MSASLYEIVELANGDVVLQRADEEGEPLLCIKFSTESLSFMREGKFDIAKAMIEAGMEAAGDLADAEPEESMAEEGQVDVYNKRTLH
ncbi:hypothetical protein [Gilvimarinus sp. DA14]|uniref:hypothetical protein n=1 Tax=Gilvimarinus sp. DA14 TaxID=2956798 RepID=UPI0020B69147|nr:hypothetical protein [Gilvimarinus sp. DA14]UTF60943.1 hypothetical protein NHM04_03850 [Gilvimarinus sp. DA14]